MLRQPKVLFTNFALDDDSFSSTKCKLSILRSSLTLRESLDVDGTSGTKTTAFYTTTFTNIKHSLTVLVAIQLQHSILTGSLTLWELPTALVLLRLQHTIIPSSLFIPESLTALLLLKLQLSILKLH